MLTLPRLVLRNLAYHWRGNLAVLLGVAVGSAVLTGALLVGDSLRGSLRASRRTATRRASTRPRCCRDPFGPTLPMACPGERRPVLLLPGRFRSSRQTKPTAPYLGRITVLGVDDRFKPVERSGLER